MKKTILASAVLLATLSVTFSSCTKDDDVPQPATTIEKTDSLKVNFSATAPFTFFSFKNGAVIANTDSATTKWDFGLRQATLIFNSNASGPGNAGVILQNSLYNNVTTAPDAGYAYDTTASQKAIKNGSWYNYNQATNPPSFSPKSGQTFILRTADNNYVKMELLSVDYEPFVGPMPVRLIYRFRYTYQANGTKNF
jgi:hypothetical protein